MPERNYRKMMLLLLIFCALSSVISYFVYANSSYWILKNSWWILIVFCVEIVIEMFLYLNKNIRSAHAQLIIQSKLIEVKNKEILESIRYAKRIQRAILPPEKLLSHYFGDSFILYKPKDIVAGDFYWMEKKDDLILFAAADCTGHGVPGALVSVVCNNSLNRAVREFNCSDPGKILNKTRDLIILEFEKSEEEVKDGMDISLCVLNLKTRKLLWAGANNPVLVVKNTSKELTEIKGNKQPIGKHIQQVPFQTHEIDLEKGDAIYICTDGIQDQFGGKDGKKFKAARLKELLLQNSSKPLDTQKQILQNTIEEWMGNLEQVDDMCVIGIRI